MDIKQIQVAGETYDINDAAARQGIIDLSALAATKVEVQTVDDRVNAIITTPIDGLAAAQELVDARQGSTTLGENLTGVKSQLAESANRLWSSKEKPTAAVTFTDDDGSIDFYNKIRPLCLAKNCKYTSAYVTGTPSMTDEQLTQLQADGLFEFISHSHEHLAPDERTDEELRVDFTASIAWLKARGMNYKAYAAPGGRANPRTRRIIREYFDYHFSGFETYTIQPINQYDIGRFDMFSNAADTLETYKGYVDHAIAIGAWIVFIGHAWQAAFNTTILSGLIDYIQSLNVDIISCAEGIDRFGNLIDVGDHSLQNDGLHEYFVVGKNGASKSSGDFAMANDTNITFATPISYFPFDKMVCSSVVSGSDFPDAQGGNLWTYRINHSIETNNGYDVNSFQLWLPYYTNKMFKRRWDTTQKAWGKFNPIGGSIVAFENSHTTLSTPADITQTGGDNTVVVTPIKASNTDIANFPEAKAGFLTTYNIMVDGSSFALVYQDYKVYDSVNTYRRRWAGSWTAWDKIISSAKAGSAVAPANAYTTLSTPADIANTYGSNIVVVSPVYSSNTDLANFPEGKTGYLTTYNIMVAGSFGYVCQEYRASQSNNVYKRFWNSVGSVWTTWVRTNGNLALTTAQRTALSAVGRSAGDTVFDTTLSKPVWYTGTAWVDATGSAV